MSKATFTFLNFYNFLNFLILLLLIQNQLITFCTAKIKLKSKPLILAHRGACGKYPPHTELSYKEGATYGDIIECDIAMTKDFKLICLHDSWMGKTTNISEVYPERRKRRVWNGKVMNDWFSVDFR